eukprot:CAMPEP_0114262112 /NCGR_PEP_ID=MMETSP0058-20121206/21577_1 /TAXON_ID=36894 /ORGANISM="Pyramimonas parkeae, CCMP726" /LENGTH=140 /DNA_ID=CAMNT_0001377853 /DNA_START=397 /DNA_END=816 /DNA_ORIENTATION=+
MDSPASLLQSSSSALIAACASCTADAMTDSCSWPCALTTAGGWCARRPREALRLLGSYPLPTASVRGRCALPVSSSRRKWAPSCSCTLSGARALPVTVRISQSANPVRAIPGASDCSLPPATAPDIDLCRDCISPAAREE